MNGLDLHNAFVETSPFSTEKKVSIFSSFLVVTRGVAVTKIRGIMAVPDHYDRWKRRFHLIADPSEVAIVFSDFRSEAATMLSVGSFTPFD